MTESEALLFAAKRLTDSGEAGMIDAVIFLEYEAEYGPKAVRDEAIWILDCFASTPGLMRFSDHVNTLVADLATAAYEAAPGSGMCRSEFSEAAQILRDGWNPGDTRMVSLGRVSFFIRSRYPTRNWNPGDELERL